MNKQDNEIMFSRREFLKASGLSAGGLIIGVSVPASVLAQVGQRVLTLVHSSTLPKMARPRSIVAVVNWGRASVPPTGGGCR